MKRVWNVLCGRAVVAGVVFLFFAGSMSYGSVEILLSSSTPDVWTIRGDAGPETGISVPHVMNRYGVGYDTDFRSRTFTYEREFDVPPEIERMPRKYIRFERSNWRTTVYVNGVEVGVHDGGFHAFEVDIGKSVKPSGNGLRVVVEDYHCVLGGGKKAVEGAEGLVGLVGLDGGWNYLRGIHDDVYLVGRNDIYLTEHYVWGTVRGDSAPRARDAPIVHARTSVANRSAGDAVAEIRYSFKDGADVDHVLTSGPIRVRSGHSTTFDMHDTWGAPRLWWPDDPFLYDVTVSVEIDGVLVDSATFEFGFRDFYSRNPEMEPYVDEAGNVMGDMWLNGVRVRLRADLYLFDGRLLDESGIDEVLASARESNFNAIRLRGGTFRKSFYRAADRVGMMLIEEMPFDGSRNLGVESVTYDYVNPGLWRTAERQVAEIVKDKRRFASIVLWSAGNEVGGRASTMLRQYPPFLENVSSLYGVFRAHDPSREVMFGGQTRHLFPFIKDLFIYSGYCVDGASPANGSSSNERPFAGEAVLAADDVTVYRQTMNYRTFRNWDVFGFYAAGTMSGRTEVMKRAFRPYVAYCANQGGAFFEGQTVARQFVVMNDSFHGGEFLLRVTVRDTNGWSFFARDVALPGLGPGEVERVEVEFTAPRVGDSNLFTVDYDLWRGDEVVDENRHSYRVERRREPLPDRLDGGR